MKLLTFLTTLSLVAGDFHTPETLAMRENMKNAPDYDFLVSKGVDVEAQFDLMVKKGIYPVDGYFTGASGEMAMVDLADKAGLSDREDLFFDLCGFVEGLFTGVVLCACVEDWLLGRIGYDCVTPEPRIFEIFTYSPAFFGSFVYILFQIAFSFVGGVCLDDVSFYDESLPEIAINLGDFCFITAFTTSFTFLGGLQFQITNCDIFFGSVADCGLCTPCVDPVSGLNGILIDCQSPFIQFDLILPCIPVELPLTPKSPPAGEGAFISTLYDCHVMENYQARAIADLN